MTYLLQTKRKKSLSFLFPGIFLIFILMVLFSPLSFVVRNLGDKVARTLLPDSFVVFLYSKKALNAENEILKKENEALKAEIQSGAELEEENKRLKESLSLLDTEEFVFGSVVLRGGGSSSLNKIVVRVNDGIEIGDSVYFKNIPIGKVEEVNKNLATVILLSSPQNRFGVSIGSPAFESEAHGLGGGSFEVFVPKGVEVASGDSVSIPSFGNRTFSKISDVSSDSADSFQRVLFSFPFNLNYVDLVAIKKSNE